MCEGTRLDTALVARSMFESRSQAKAAILEGRVLIDGKAVLKPSAVIQPSAVIHVEETKEAFVSRAGEKLQAALTAMQIDPTGMNGLDVGASTGGFTDCLLQGGASSMICVDVGHGQLRPRLADDARVTSFEGINARYLTAEMLPRASFDVIVIDVSFISLQLVLPAVWQLLDTSNPQARLIALVKPQFEAGKQAVKRGRGVVKDQETHDRVLNELRDFATSSLINCTVLQSIDSPILGSDGNREFLLGLARSEHQRASEPATLTSVARPEVGIEDGLTPDVRRKQPLRTAAARAAAHRNKKALN